MSIANSPLVKTAIAGEDANWGRIVMAIGKAGEKAIRDKLRIRIGGIQVAKNGMRDPDYKEAEIMPHMKGREIVIEADVGVGKRQGQGLDLRSHPSLYRHQRFLSQLMRILLVAAVALVDPDGRVLIAKRPEGKTLAGLWEFPGGKVEPR